MGKSWLMLLLACILAVAFMAVIAGMIPKTGVRMGAPEDIQEAMQKLPDKPKRVTVTGTILAVILAVCIVCLFIWAAMDAVQSGLGFWKTFLRFVIILDGYKIFDIIVFDYFLLYKSNIFIRMYPELKGLKGFDSFGFNARSQIAKLFGYAGVSLILAGFLQIF